MNGFEQKLRFLANALPKEDGRRIVLITGARQTGKTTLVKQFYANFPYINLDAVENRDKLRQISSMRWSKDIGKAVIDEAQKEPSLFEKIKYAYDAGELNFSVLLGSSQILLMKNIRESLAGRISIHELYPLTLSEIYAREELKEPLLDKLLTGKSLNTLLEDNVQILLPEQQKDVDEAVNYMLRYGGMPALLYLSSQEKMEWLRDYEYTYLQRDLADLARLFDLQPFRLLQKLAALRAASLLNYSELARDAALSVDTTKRYLEYLKLSYQVELLPPFPRDLTSQSIKTPKLYWLDIGIWRSITGYVGETTGQLFENFVVSEMIKWIRTAKRQVDLYFYRTRSGMEIDILLQLPQGIIGVEIKSRSKVSEQDCTPIKKLAQELGKEWLGGLIVYRGEVLQKICEPAIWAMPVSRLFIH